MAFNPLVKKIEKARYRVANFDSARMGEIGQAVTRSVIARIYSGQNANDAPARPLSVKYARQKRIKGRKPVRDMTFSGLTMASLHVLKAGNNQATIGFTDPLANRRAFFSNRKEMMFGMSPKNMDDFLKAVKSKPIVEVVSG